MTDGKSDDIAWLDTTVLVEATLKPWREHAVKEGLRGLEIRTPEYAVKEMKRGPLMYYVWAYNILVEDCSETHLRDRVNSVYRMRYRQAAINAVFANLFDPQETLDELVAAHGRHAKIDKIRGLQLKAFFLERIFDAWNQRYALGAKTLSLTCYDDREPLLDKRNMVKLPAKSCRTDCCLSEKFSQVGSRPNKHAMQTTRSCLSERNTENAAPC